MTQFLAAWEQVFFTASQVTLFHAMATSAIGAAHADTLKSASDKSDHFRGTWPPQTLRESRGHRAVARIHTTFHSHWL